MALHALLRRHARYRPNATAVVFRGERYTHADLDRRVNRIANALADMGLGRDSKVALILDNCLEVIEVYQAAAKTGMVVVPLSPLLRGDGLVNLVNDADTEALITMERLVPEIDAVRDRLDLEGRSLARRSLRGYVPAELQRLNHDPG